MRPVRSTFPYVLLVCCLVLACSTVVVAQTEDTDETDDEEIEIERVLEIEIRLIGVEKMPRPESTAIARFRVLGGEYQGAIFSLAYDYTRPIQLRSWNVHEPSGYRRIGGNRVDEPRLGQWDELFRLGSHEPVETIFMSLIQTDLNEDEEDRRWHFTAIESIRPFRVYDILDPQRGRRREVPAALPDR
jgi:hypothetical protein